MSRMEDFMQLQVVTSSAATTTVGPNDVIINITGSGARTVTTDASAQALGRILIIVDAAGNAAANNITFDPVGSVTVNGAATAVINTNRGVLRLYCDGTNWLGF